MSPWIGMYLAKPKTLPLGKEVKKVNHTGEITKAVNLALIHTLLCFHLLTPVQSA